MRAHAVLTAALGTAILCVAPAMAGPAAAGDGESCPAPPKAMGFAEQGYVETGRAGGEPSIITHPDGTLLYGAHAGTTHFYAPAAGDPDTAAFVQHYTNQTYIWRSTDGGKRWTFVDRSEPPENLPGSGFSDPDFAIDTVGNVWASEINLANVAVSKSTDSGATFTLQNFFAQTMTDRQWKAADEEDVVYIVGNAFAGGTFPNDPVGNVGHHLYKSKDGGRTFGPGIPDGDGLGDIQVDQRNGTLYEAYYDGETLSMAAYREIRDDDFTREQATIAEGVDMLSHWPAIDVDSAGNLYIVWDESGRGGRHAGIWYAFSRDGGRSWSTPTRVDRDAPDGSDPTDIWPWIAVGDPRRVAIAYLEADVELPDHDAQTPGEHGWRIVAAQTLKGLGCDDSDQPGFRLSTATPEPVHRGTICQGGTVCQAQLIDRRLGDYFTIDITRNGRLWAGYSDTRQGGGVALPGVVFQDEGSRFIRKRAKRSRTRR